MVGKVPLQLKTDSFAVESTIHFPTDFNLLWDSVRKCFDLLEQLKLSAPILGFRKLQYWRKKSYSAYRKAAEIHRKKGKNYQVRLTEATTKYLDKAGAVLKRVKVIVSNLTGKVGLKESILLELIQKFYDYGVKHVDLVNRRVLLGEKIPHSEKIFSVFEEHVEWLQKGKAGNQVELGHNVSITTDQWRFILDWEVVEKQADKQLTVDLGRRLQKNYGLDYDLDRISFDRGYYSLLGEKALQKIFTTVVMPKPGKKTASRELAEATPEFEQARRKHCAVESNINELEQSGADKVPDKGIDGFKKYVGWSVLAHNLKRLGELVIKREALSTVKCYKKAA